LLRSRTVLIFLMALVAWPIASQARGCAAFGDSPARAGARSPGAKPPAIAPAHGLDLANLDRSASPCQDFYDFADGGWIESHSIPPGRASWGVIDELKLRDREILREILERAAEARAQAEPGSAERKLGDFYAACMNIQAIDAAGWKPIAPELRRIARLRNLSELERELGRLHEMGVGALFGFGATPDFTGSGNEIASAYQSGLGLPSPAAYIQNDAYSRQLRETYLTHISRMFGLLGDSSVRARGEAQTVLRIETLLARAWAPAAGPGDPTAAFHKMSVANLQALTPHFSWARYFHSLKLAGIDTVDVAQPRYFAVMNQELVSVPLADWKIYLRWQLIHHFAPDLSEPFVDENSDFYGRTLGQTRQIQPRWQRCVAAARRELSGPLNREYVARAFSPARKAAALALVRDLIGAFRQDLQGLYWMDSATRAAAVAKLDRMTVQAGYPDKWRDDSAYQVTRGPFVENMLRGEIFHFHLELARIGKPIDRFRWTIPASAVQAIYDPTRNEIVLPAGILQPPFFDPAADDALNYGAIGSVIGHEMTHGFDDEGSRFNGDGRLKGWWTPEDMANYQQLASCVVDQYDTYVAARGLHENGQRVLGESAADIGGLAIAYQAFEKSGEFNSRKKIQGFTPRQRFFLAYARIWAEREDPRYIRLAVGGDPHAAAKFRVIGPLADFEPFAQAFQCRAKDAMVRPEPDRCGIW
jgi:putative endopeptidase